MLEMLKCSNAQNSKQRLEKILSLFSQEKTGLQKNNIKEYKRASKFNVFLNPFFSFLL
jgi:hypothetical protein